MVPKSKDRGRKDAILGGVENEGLWPRVSCGGRRKGKGCEALQKDMKLSGHRKKGQATRGPEMGNGPEGDLHSTKREEQRKDRRGEEGGGRRQ